MTPRLGDRVRSPSRSEPSHSRRARGSIPRRQGAFAEGTNPKAARPGFRPGAVIARRYQLRQLIGSGGFGFVYRATDLELGVEVALKVVRPEADVSSLDQFRREIQLARLVTHPNVCRIFDMGYHVSRGVKTPFLTMELLEGDTLSDLIARYGSLSASTVATIGMQVADALDAAHGVGIIHSDIKPSNIVLIQRGSAIRAVVTDFGLAATAKSNPARGGVVLGTPAYIAPELVRGAPHDRAADYYSLGCTLFHLATGRAPFDCTTPQETAYARLGREAPRARDRNPSLPRELDSVIGRLMRHAPEDRLCCPAEIRRELRPRGTFRAVALGAAAGIATAALIYATFLL